MNRITCPFTACCIDRGNMGGTGIELLPNEALISVFELLPAMEVFRTCGLVNRRFSEVAFSADLWRNKVLSLPEVRIPLGIGVAACRLPEH
jgi:hypothetical protein